MQLAAELTTLINLQAQLDFRFTTQNLDQNLSINSSTTEFVTDNKINANTNTSLNSEPDSKNLQTYPGNYNPFAHGDLTETFYKLRAFLKSRYRDAQEIKYPYLAKLRREREQKENLQRAAREQAGKQAVALKLVRDYNRRLNNLPRQTDSSLNQPGQASLSELYQAKISAKCWAISYFRLRQL